ncbi:hypothetical protein DH2020_021580 [Rehmannia glutinosa]|uniref:Protein kinase domain-containing protein n=1 Tax=Rehmannia glutinosa TaxID=99300 RepID=A0ABR0WF30_REHGL
MMDYPITIQKLKYKKLVIYTDDFSESNYISRFQFGKLYRGLIPNPRRKRYVMVEIWEVPEIYNYEPGDNKIRLMEETILLRHEMLISHPGMLKLYGYCCEGEHLGAVYEFRPFDSLFNLIPKAGFTWLQRIKAALGLASVLKFLHAGNSSFYVPFIVQNLDAAHVVLDEAIMSLDATATLILLHPAEFDIKESFHRRKQTSWAPFVYEWAIREFEAYEKSEGDMNNTNFSLVHKSLAAECDLSCPADAHKITMLALECVNKAEHERPTMKQVFRSLRKLEVVKQHADYLKASTELCPWEIDI